MEYLKLDNNVNMPIVGLGTWTLKGDNLASLIKEAVSLGYRKFDTAWKYKNEKDLGKAFKMVGVDRDKLFLTSKLHLNDLYLGGYHKRFHIKIKDVKSAYYASCKRLGVDYLDMYLMHWPFLHYEELWKGMLQLYEDKLVKAIGVCSFCDFHLEKISKLSSVKPMLNQIEISPLNTRNDVRKYCLENHIPIEAYSTFGAGYLTNAANKTILNHPQLVDLAGKYGKSVGQIILRWLVQQGISVVPRSRNYQRLADNINIFDFELLPYDMEKIESLNQNIFAWGNPQNAR